MSVCVDSPTAGDRLPMIYLLTASVNYGLGGSITLYGAKAYARFDVRTATRPWADHPAVSPQVLAETPTAPRPTR